MSPIFLIFISENDAKHRKPNSFITPMTRDMGQNMLPAVKNGKLFVAYFSDFYLAVSASRNDAKHRTPNSFITPMIRDMRQIMLQAEKTENFLSPIFLIFISENDAKRRKPNSFITPMTRDM